MATRREDIIVSLGGDSKALLKDLNMSRQQVQSFARDVAKSISEGHIPEAWKSYSKNASAALKQVDATAQKTNQTVGQGMVQSVGKAVKAFLGFAAVAKVVREASKALDDMAERIAKYGGKVDVQGYRENALRQSIGGMSEEQQANIVVTQFQKSQMFDLMKDKLARMAAVAVTSTAVWRDMFKNIAAGKPSSLASSSAAVEIEQRAIYDGMKALQAQKDVAEVAKKKLETEKELAKVRDESNKANAVELKKWLAENQFQREVEKFHLDRQLAARKRITEEIIKQRKLQSPGVLGYRQEPQSVEQTAEELGGVQYPDLYAGLNEYQRRTRASSDRWKQHVAGMTPEAIRRNTMRSSIRDPRQVGNTGPNADVVKELQKLTGPMEATGRLPVKVELDK